MYVVDYMDHGPCSWFMALRGNESINSEDDDDDNDHISFLNDYGDIEIGGGGTGATILWLLGLH